MSPTIGASLANAKTYKNSVKNARYPVTGCRGSQVGTSLHKNSLQPPTGLDGSKTNLKVNVNAKMTMQLRKSRIRSAAMARVLNASSTSEYRV